MREGMPLIFGWKVDFAKHPTPHLFYISFFIEVNLAFKTCSLGGVQVWAQSQAGDGLGGKGYQSQRGARSWISPSCTKWWACFVKLLWLDQSRSLHCVSRWLIFQCPTSRRSPVDQITQLLWTRTTRWTLISTNLKLNTHMQAFSWGFGGYGRLGHSETADELVSRYSGLL